MQRNIEVTQQKEWIAMLENLVEKPELEITDDAIQAAKFHEVHFQDGSEQATNAKKVLDILNKSKTARAGN